MRAFLFGFALLVAGCAGPRMADLHQDCGLYDKPFPEFWECQKPRVVADYSRMPGDLKDGYLALGQALSERVRAKQVSQAEARVALVNYTQYALDKMINRSVTQSPPPVVVYGLK